MTKKFNRKYKEYKDSVNGTPTNRICKPVNCNNDSTPPPPPNPTP